MATKAEIISDYRSRAVAEKAAGWTCSIDLTCENLIVIRNPEYPDDDWVFRGHEVDELLARTPEWVLEELSQEEYLLAQIMNW